MHLGQKMSIHNLSAHGEKVIFHEKTQSRNCASRSVHELKIIHKTVVSSWFQAPAHISRFVSEQNLHQGSFSKIPVKTLNRPLFRMDGSRRFHEPEENLVRG
jgi:hypothetical protein